MSMIETINDENNSFLSRREITCDFKGLGGRLKKMEAVEMITKEYKLDGKFVVPMKLHTHTGQSKITGVFFVYEDEKLAKKHVSSVIFQRLDKAKAKDAEPPKEDTKSDAEPPKEDTKSDAEPPKEDTKSDAEPPKEDTKSDAEKGESS
jgi:ribosomal protein S24E